MLTSLTNEQLIAEYRRGNRDAYNLLFERNEHVIRLMAKPFVSRWTDLKDDIVQEGMIGAMMAVDSFAPEKDEVFIAACAVPVTTNILLFLRKERLLKGECYESL